MIVLYNVCIYKSTRSHALSRVDRFVKNYQGLPLHHRKMLPGMPSHIQALKSAIDVNQQFVEMIIASAVGMFENSQVSQFVSNLLGKKILL